MCSISGYIANKPLPLNTAHLLSSALIYYGYDRGNQSAGVVTAHGLAKNNVAPSTFISSPAFTSLLSHQTTWSLSHTRYPTCGGKGPEQAQPFTRNQIDTVHNGWYWNAAELATTFSLTYPSGVDSELVTAYIARYGIRSINTFLSVTAGPSAIAAQVGGKLYGIANGNPFHYAHLSTGNNTHICVFASTHEQLEHSLLHTFLLPQKPTILELPDYQLYQLTPHTIKPIGKPLDYAYTTIPQVTRHKKTKKAKLDIPSDDYDLDTSYLSELSDDVESDLLREYRRNLQND